VICNAIICSVAVWNLSLAQSVGQNCMFSLHTTVMALLKKIISANRRIFDILGRFLFGVYFHYVGRYIKHVSCPNTYLTAFSLRSCGETLLLDVFGSRSYGWHYSGSWSFVCYNSSSHFCAILNFLQQELLLFPLWFLSSCAALSVSPSVWAIFDLY
jgi:hypothetical protein